MRRLFHLKPTQRPTPRTLGHERSAPWRQSLALLDHIATLTEPFDADPFGLAGRLRSIAADLPTRCAVCFEQTDYPAATAHAQAISEQLFTLVATARIATHRGLMTGKQLTALCKLIDKLDDTVNDLPDELFEDDGQDDQSDAA